MRASNFGFKEQDVANIDIIIEAINELVSCIKLLRQPLCVEMV